MLGPSKREPMVAHTSRSDSSRSDSSRSDRSGSHTPISNNSRSGWRVQGYFLNGEPVFAIEKFAEDASIGNLKMRLREQGIDYSRWHSIIAGTERFKLADDYTKFMLTKAVKEHADRVLPLQVIIR